MNNQSLYVFIIAFVIPSLFFHELNEEVSMLSDSTQRNASAVVHFHNSDDDCISCHSRKINYPSLSEFTSKKCDDCHTGSFARSSITEWRHPIEDFAYVGKSCVDCHEFNDEGIAKDIVDIDPLCIACHSDVRNEFRLLSKHPLSEGMIGCSDCHKVHKDRFMPLIVNDVELLGALTYEWHDPVKQNESCLGCHSWFRLTSLTNSGFIIANVSNLHEVHCKDGFSACIECHNPHGSYAPMLIRERLLDGKSLLYNRGESWGTCSTNCHSRAHIQTLYGADPKMLSFP